MAEKYTSDLWNSLNYRKYFTDTDTITTLPKTIIGDGTAVSAYTVKGDMSQSGTPTPSVPIYPSECGDRTENLCYKIITNATIDSNGRIVYDANFDIALAPVSQDSAYSALNLSNVYAWFMAEPSLGSQSYNQSRNAEVLINKISPLTGFVAVRYTKAYSSNATIVKGSTAPTTYIPYGYQIPLTLGNTTTNIYLGEVQSNRQIKKLVLTGEEDYPWYQSLTRNYSWYLHTNTIGTIMYTPFYCSHGETVTNVSDYGYGKVYCDNTFNLGIFDSSIDTRTKLNNYFAQQYANGTPVTIWYVLATPTTATLNEPLRKIGAYADSVSGSNLPTSGQAESFDVGTTLKPSEVSLTYHGWHEKQDKKYTNGAWVENV